MVRKVEVVPHNPQWRKAFQCESQEILQIFGKNVVAVHHIGSTAIPHIYAKPIIDLLIEVKEIAKVDQNNRAMQRLGYTAMGEYGIPGRRYFYGNNELGIRLYHVHIFEKQSPEVKRHLAFRDYLIAHPEEAQQYSELKRELAKKYVNDFNGYMDGKDSFIQEIDRKAAEWL